MTSPSLRPLEGLAAELTIADLIDAAHAASAHMTGTTNWAAAMLGSLRARSSLPASALSQQQAARDHDYPILAQFHMKHALGALSAPSCLCCGLSTQGKEIGIQHLELPAIVICKTCKDAASLPASTPDDSFASWVLAEIARRGGSAGALSLAAQLFGVAPCEVCGYRKLHCRCAPVADTAINGVAATTGAGGAEPNYRKVLQDIAEMTDADDPDSYRNDAPHDCLEAIATMVAEALTQSPATNKE